jgi:hypothetical protein
MATNRIIIDLWKEGAMGMPESVTLLATLGGPVLTEGIKFLYAQASEILKRWRERQDKATTQQIDQPQATNISLPQTVFEGDLMNPVIHFDVVQQLEKQLRQLRLDLSDYAEGVDKVYEPDAALLGKIDTLRNLLESIFKQNITFKGETRPPSGAPAVFGLVDAKEIMGYATGVEVETVTDCSIEGKVVTGRIGEGGIATGVRAKTIRGKSS